MSNINSLYREYFQKSRIFLYPALKIRKGSSITPIQTYVSLEGKHKPQDRRLICLYQMRDDREYKEFERTKLKGNPLFEELIHTQDVPPKGVYIFNFNQHDKDWDNFLKGRYSKISPKLKTDIKTFFRKSGNNYVYIESFVHPDKYYALYSELLGVSIEELSQVGELCDPPNLEKEALKIEMKKLGLDKISK